MPIYPVYTIIYLYILWYNFNVLLVGGVEFQMFKFKFGHRPRPGGVPTPSPGSAPRSPSHSLAISLANRLGGAFFFIIGLLYALWQKQI